MHLYRTIGLAVCFSAVTLAGCGKNDKPDATEDTATSSETTVPETTLAETITPPTDQTLILSSEDSANFKIQVQSPGNDATHIALTSKIIVAYSQDILANSFDSSLISVTQNGRPVAGLLADVGGDRVEFTPSSLLLPSTVYRVSISDGVMSTEGEVSNAYEWTFTTVADVFTTPQSVIDLCMSDLDIEMLAAVNATRVVARTCGDDAMPAVNKLKWNCTIQAAAIGHSVDMSSNDFFSHTGSGGTSAGDRMTRAGYVWGYAGENLAAGQRNVTEAMDGLLDSPGHCLNIMNEHYTEFGSGYSYNTNTYYKHYWTQNYGTPY